MADKYAKFSELARSEDAEVDYRVKSQYVSETLVLAPHAGGIEPGTSELAKAIAANDCSLYLFEGLKTEENGDLHITSTNFDEPQCLDLLQSSDSVLAIHGEAGDARVTRIGGLDVEKKHGIAIALQAAGFEIQLDDQSHLAGRSRQNICNRGRTSSGVQLEITAGLRRTFFRGLTTRSARAHTTKDFKRFVNAVRLGLLDLDEVGR